MDPGVDVAGVEGDAQRTVDGASRGDRDGDIEQIGPEGLRGPDASSGASREGERDLRATGEVAVDGLVGVDPRGAVAVDHDDPRPGAGPVLVGGSGVEETAAFEVVLVERGQHARVVFDVGFDLIALTLGVEGGERELQQHQHQHGDREVAEEQSSGHPGAVPGSMSRYPTERTVSIRSGWIFLRSDATWTSRVLVDPHQCSSHTSCMSCSRALTAPGSAAR